MYVSMHVYMYVCVYRSVYMYAYHINMLIRLFQGDWQTNIVAEISKKKNFFLNFCSSDSCGRGRAERSMQDIEGLLVQNIHIRIHACKIKKVLFIFVGYHCLQIYICVHAFFYGSIPCNRNWGEEKGRESQEAHLGD